MSRGGADADTAAGVVEKEVLPPALPPAPTLPTASPPATADLRICLNPDPSLGFCIYAGRPYARGECLFRERTALEATHDVDPRGVRNVYERYCRLSAARRDALHGSFPVLAWANGVDAAEAAAARSLIGSRLLTKRCTLDIAVTAEQHMQMRPDRASAGTAAALGAAAAAAAAAARGAEPAGWSRAARNFLFRRKPQPPQPPQPGDGSDRSSTSSGGSSQAATAAAAAAAARPPSAPPSPDVARRLTLEWFGRYAFRLKPGSAFTDGGQGGHHQAAVYLLTDLINHRCAGFQNCRVAAEVGTIAVLAVRDIAAGEEVTINYSKDVKDFRCKGECCARK